MAEFLLMPFGSAGDTFPFVGLGRRLAERGHQVILAANGHFAAAVKDAGLEHHEIGTAEEYLASIEDPAIWHPRKGFAAVVGHPRMPEIVERQHAFVIEQFQRHRDVTVVAGSLAFGARVAAETHGVRHVTVHLSPSVFPSVERPPASQVTIPAWWPRAWVRALYWAALTFMIEPVLRKSVGRFRRELGLPPVPRYLWDWIHSPELVLGLFPDWFAEPASDWPPQTELTGFPLHDIAGDQPLTREVREYLKAGAPPVVITFGSAMKVGRRLFATAIETCQRLGRRGLLLTPFAEQLPDPLPHDMQWFGYVPLTTLLPHAAALVHHGGIGTTAQGLRAGVPQLITPLAHDQFDNAVRVRRLGAGESLPASQVTTRRLTRVLNPLLNRPEAQAGAARVAERLRDCDGLEKTCLRLEDFSRQPRSRSRG